MNIRCVDDYIKRCHLIIDEFMINYKKQVFIIDIKMNKHCNICKIRSNERQNLIKKWKYRTHEYI